MTERDRFSLDWDLSIAKHKNSTLPHIVSNQHLDEEILETSEDRCAVCLSKGEDTLLLPCAHQFHGKCILRWVDQNFSCPLCRQVISQFVPLNTNDPKIHQQFVDIWERHHYGGTSGVVSESSLRNSPSESDLFRTEKPKEISLSEVAALEQDIVNSQVGEPVPVNQDISGESSEEEYKFEDIKLSEEQIHDVEEEFGNASNINILLDMDSTCYSTIVVRTRPLLMASSPMPLHFNWLPQENILTPLQLFLGTVGQRIYDKSFHIASFLLPERHHQKNALAEDEEVVKLSVKLPTSYKLNESLEAGFLSGCLTASLLSLTTRPSNLYPLFREVVPNVAIFFTVYEDLKSRNMDSSIDTRVSAFVKRTLCAGAAATIGHLPQNRFKVTVPVRFGLQFGFFELFKDNMCLSAGDFTKDHSKLSPIAIGASALCGGVLAATSAYPLELYMKYMDKGQASYLASYQTFMRRFLPGCVFTAVSFEFGRRWIHLDDHEDD